MNQDAIYAGLTEIFAVAFPDQDIELQPETTAADVEGWDSLKQVEIIVMAQQKFSVRLTTREVDALSSVGDLARTIASHLAKL
jgi:acyl carrier protein